MFRLPVSISTPSSCSSIIMLLKSTLPLLVTVIVYSIISPSLTSASIPMLAPSLVMFVTSFVISISAVGTLFSSVSFSPTIAVLVISPSISSTSTVNCTDALSPTGTFTLFQVRVLLFSDTVAPSADTNVVSSGIASSIEISPATSPVFIAVIVYIIWSPTFAILLQFLLLRHFLL